MDRVESRVEGNGPPPFTPPSPVVDKVSKDASGVHWKKRLSRSFESVSNKEDVAAVSVSKKELAADASCIVEKPAPQMVNVTQDHSSDVIDEDVSSVVANSDGECFYCFRNAEHPCASCGDRRPMCFLHPLFLAPMGAEDSKILEDPNLLCLCWTCFPPPEVPTAADYLHLCRYLHFSRFTLQT